MPKNTNDGKIRSTSTNCRMRVCLRTNSNINDLDRWGREEVETNGPDATKANQGSPLQGGRRESYLMALCSHETGTTTCWWVLRGSNPRPTPCKGAALPTELSTRGLNQLTASFRALPGRNLGTLAALILMVAPVRGLRPERAARLLTLKVPKPTSETLLFFLSVDFTPPIRASSARVAAALEMSACLAMCSINSDLFTKGPSQVVSGIRVNADCEQGEMLLSSSSWTTPAQGRDS